jgi:phosphoserine/homoserine phosphotransferase
VIVVCLDLEGVLVPEVWINVAEREGIEALRLTTRDIPDYDELMGHRLRVLEEHNLTISHIQAAIDTLSPLEGALAFLDGLREQYQVIILSDTFYQFAEPLMRQLAWPTLFCHDLDIDSSGRIAGYRLRQADQKRQAVKALHDLNFKVVAAGDSYNDTSMLGEADRGILFCPPDNVIREFPQFPVTRDYAALRTEIDTAASAIQ